MFNKKKSIIIIVLGSLLLTSIILGVYFIYQENVFNHQESPLIEEEAAEDRVAEREERRILDKENVKVAIASEEGSLDSEISQRFARAPYFIFIKIENGEIEEKEFLENEFAKAQGHVNYLIAELMQDKEVDAIIGKNPGMNVLMTLKEFNIPVYLSDEIVRQSLDRFLNNDLEIRSLY